MFDREGDDGKFVSVTVKATDQGDPSLEGVCSFTVEITDVNDNPPLFDRQKYVENVKQDTNIGTNILRVSASDEDADNNGAIVYNLTAYNADDLSYFTILPESGWIVLTKPLDVSRNDPLPHQSSFFFINSNEYELEYPFSIMTRHLHASIHRFRFFSRSSWVSFFLSPSPSRGFVSNVESPTQPTQPQPPQPFQIQTPPTRRPNRNIS